VPAAANCGDGHIEAPAEECEDGNDVNGDGCDRCRFSCVSTDSARNCVSPDPCPGSSKCDDSTHTCKLATPPLTDRADCGDKKICLNNACTDTYCGNGKLDGKEECDDGNSSKGDGCEPDCTFSCVPGVAGRNCESPSSCINPGTCDKTTHACSALVTKAPGTTCDGGNCVQGNCIPITCGDGIKGGSEQCDDGNQSNTDACTTQCKAVCGSPGDCASRTTAPCRAPACTSGACTTTADTSKNGQACMTSGGTATCNNGACTSGTCGDGLGDQGEQCDDSNKTDGDGCDSDCMYSCQADADCDDKNPCNGVEKCQAVPAGKKCGIDPAQPALVDGTSCGTGKLCSSSICRAGFCGDGYTDKTAGESCDPPNTVGCDSSCKAITTCQLTGNWAMKVAAKVTWSGAGLVDGQGEIDQWALLNIKQNTGDTSFTATLKACGIAIPDFHTIPNFGDETYGITFASAAFDSPKVPTVQFSGQLGSLAPGASFQTVSAAVLLGLDVKSAAIAVGPWPGSYKDLTAANGFTITDVDSDGNPGITGTPKTGMIPGSATAYKDIIWDIGDPPLQNPGRSKALFLAIRQIASEKGTLNSCTEISGNTVAVIDNHIIGCVADAAGATCDPGLLDLARPIYTTQSATFTASLIGSQDTCSVVRAKVP
jgi:cysteine-rich repeat protein